MSSLIPEIEAMGYPENSDITIMNTYYSFPEYSDGHKVSDDKIFLVFKDNVTNEKKYKIIEKPDYTFYKIKDGEKIPNYNQMFIEKEKVEPEEMAVKGSDNGDEDESIRETMKYNG